MSAPIIKYRTGGFQNRIERVEVLRETGASVFIARTIRGMKLHVEERREAKRGEFAQYHDSWESAYVYLITRAESKVRNARRELERANGELGNIKGMKPPTASQPKAEADK